MIHKIARRPNRRRPNVVRMNEAVTNPTDEQLIADYAQGRTDGFEVLVERYTQELYHFLVRFTGGTATAEDVVQETFLQIHLSADSFDTSRRFKPWLFTIAANKARDIMRGRARRPEVPLDATVDEDQDRGQRFLDFLSSTDAEPDRPLERAEREHVVRRTVQELPEHLRETLILAYYHKFPYKDMAEILGIPLGTVKSRLHAAVAAFSEAYRQATRPETVSE